MVLGKPLRKNDAYVTLRDLAKQALFQIEIEARTKTDLMELLEITRSNRFYEVIGFMKDKGFPVEKPKLETFLQNME